MTNYRRIELEFRGGRKLCCHSLHSGGLDAFDIIHAERSEAGSGITTKGPDAWEDNRSEAPYIFRPAAESILILMYTCTR